jgi:APA family basic amino acid/polyamine antiporter
VTAPDQRLARRLGTADAVVIGLGSMIGAGVFAAFGPAAQAAGAGLLVGLAIAAVVAYCNAVASAQLAAVYPVSGGTYAYGRARLGPWWGFAAGWAFVVGKSASCAAMALTFAAYAVDGPWWLQRLVAVAAVIGVAALNYRGVTRTASATRVLVTATVVALAVFVIAIMSSGAFAAARLRFWGGGGGFDLYGVVQAAGLLFFAFAGYARIATMGAEVADPATTIPRAIPRALAGAVILYAVVGVSALGVAGADGLAGSSAPLSTAAQTAGRGWVVPVITVGAALASLGSLLALMAGIGRTALAMAHGRDLPRGLDAVHPRFRVPHRAEAALAIIVTVLVLTTDLRHALGFSSFGVLLYYAIANASAYTQPPAQHRWPRALNVLGAGGCVGLAATLPVRSVLAGAAVIAIGLVGRWLLRRRAPKPRPEAGTAGQ